MGGDICGKDLVLAVEEAPGSYAVRGSTVTQVDGAGLDRLERDLQDRGAYLLVVTADRAAELEADANAFEAAFEEAALDRLRRWVDDLDEHFAGHPARVFVSGGNDDYYEVDEVLAASERIEDPNGRIIDLGDGLSWLGIGDGNLTPWACPRDLPEDELWERISGLADQVEHRERAIFSIHVPPYGSGLDLAPELDEGLRPRLGPDGLVMAPAGSEATARALSTHRPMLGVHGHIHESSGVADVGGTLALNPGSEYWTGTLLGAVIDVDPRDLDVDVHLVRG